MSVIPDQRAPPGDSPLPLQVQLGLPGSLLGLHQDLHDDLVLGQVVGSDVLRLLQLLLVHPHLVLQLVDQILLNNNVFSKVEIEIVTTSFVWKRDECSNSIL